MREPQAPRRLRLPEVDALDAGPEDLGDVGAGIQCQRQRAREERAMLLPEGACRFTGQQQAMVRMLEMSAEG